MSGDDCRSVDPRAARDRACTAFSAAEPRATRAASSRAARAARRGRLCDGEHGFVAGAEALVFGVLIFVIGSLVVVNAWGVIDARFAASAAAREATRAAATAPAGADLHQVAAATAAEVLAAHGRDDEIPEVAPVGASELARCAEVGFEVRLEVPVIVLPMLTRGPGAFEVVGAHRQVVDPYRSGLEAREADCAF